MCFHICLIVTGANALGLKLPNAAPSPVDSPIQKEPFEIMWYDIFV